jgi:hypothetical protein
MQKIDLREVIAGFLLVGIGLFLALHSLTNYQIGTIQQLGPGMFPTALGFLLAALGVFIMVPGFFRAGTFPSWRIRPFFTILAGVFLFSISLNTLGMIPAIFLLTGAAALADNKLSALSTLILASALSTIGVLIFRVGLGIPIQPIVWEF